MLKPVESPLSCFGLEHRPETARCKACPHFEPCRTYMGNRLNRIPISEAKFDLVPSDYLRRHEEPDPDVRDMDAIYSYVYRQVFGEGPSGYIGIYREKIADLADLAQCSIPMFMLICMFGHKQVYPNSTFHPSMLSDGHALRRVSVYAEACRAKYGEVSVNSFDKVVKDDLVGYDLDDRMLRSEILAGTWIINYKLERPGQPYLPMLHALENELDPNWLAIEKYWDETLKERSKTLDRPVHKQDAIHETILVYKRLKKRKHDAIGHFRARERALPKAIAQVLEKQGFSGDDFEIEDKVLSDPLLFWNRLGTAIQHYECLKFVNGNIGLYAVL